MIFNSDDYAHIGYIVFITFISENDRYYSVAHK